MQETKVSLPVNSKQPGLICHLPHANFSSRCAVPPLGHLLFLTNVTDGIYELSSHSILLGYKTVITSPVREVMYQPAMNETHATCLKTLVIAKQHEDKVCQKENICVTKPSHMAVGYH